ncbi:hypothetical protein SETIT_3G047500v2 [Setaria italica]|uniref:Uncharacterized protein n=1 Tax=Setaria italica TaxID=4555 RepID=A0A368QBD6_SETIT|nr:hypothetical protein SETIT_3G047500v2 [Setaria italica]
MEGSGLQRRSRIGASAGVPGSLAGPRAAPSLLVSVGARPHRSAEPRARTELALQRGRELGRGRGGALEEMKSKGLLPNITTYVTLTGAMYATQRMQVGEKLLEDIQERGLIPSKHSESLERRMEDAIRRLNMIRNCRKGMPVKEVEVLLVESFQ